MPKGNVHDENQSFWSIPFIYYRTSTHQKTCRKKKKPSHKQQPHNLYVVFFFKIENWKRQKHKRWTQVKLSKIERYAKNRSRNHKAYTIKLVITNQRQIEKKKPIRIKINFVSLFFFESNWTWSEQERKRENNLADKWPHNIKYQFECNLPISEPKFWMN